MVARAPLTGGEVRRTSLLALIILAIGTIPLLSLLGTALARSLGIDGLPPKYESPQHAFWDFTTVAWRMSIASPVACAILAFLCWLSRARAVPDFAQHTILVYLWIAVLMPLVLFSFFQNSGVLPD